MHRTPLEENGHGLFLKYDPSIRLRRKPISGQDCNPLFLKHNRHVSLAAEPFVLSFQTPLGSMVSGRLLWYNGSIYTDDMQPPGWGMCAAPSMPVMQQAMKLVSLVRFEGFLRTAETN